MSKRLWPCLLRALPGVICTFVVVRNSALIPAEHFDLFAQHTDSTQRFSARAIGHQAPSAHRVLVMQQLGQRECGTFRFRLAEALDRLPELAALQPTRRLQS